VIYVANRDEYEEAARAVTSGKPTQRQIELNKTMARNVGQLGRDAQNAKKEYEKKDKKK